MNAARQRRLTPVLVGVTLAFGILLLSLLAGIGRGVRWNPPQPPATLPPMHAGTNLPSARPLAEFAQIWEQPLFSADRKPLAQAAAGGTNLGDMQLTGIIVTPALRMALLHDKQGDRDVRVREGAAMPDGGWSLLQLKSRSAVFDNAGSRTELSLPAGAPIDRKAPSADQSAADASGASMQWLENGRPAQLQRGQPASSDQAQRNEAMRKFREAVQKRRLEQTSKPPPSGVH